MPPESPLPSIAAGAGSGAGAGRGAGGCCLRLAASAALHSLEWAHSLLVAVAPGSAVMQLLYYALFCGWFYRSDLTVGFALWDPPKPLKRGLWGWLANVHSRCGSRACVARIDHRRVTGEKQVCLLRTTR